MQGSCSGGACSMPGASACSHGGCSAGQCAPAGCGSSCGQSGCGPQDKMAELLDAAKCAKKALMKEKIMKRLDAKIGKHLDKVADVAVEMLVAKWEMKQLKGKKFGELMDKLHKAMGE